MGKIGKSMIIDDKDEFNLSEKIIPINDNFAIMATGDVKEFIKIIKEDLNKEGHMIIDEIIDKRAGDKLR